MSYLDNADNVFLSAELAGNSMTVGGLIEIQGRIDAKRLEHELERFSADAVRFRQCLVPGKGLFARPRWVPVDDAFDMRNHLTVLPPPGSLAAMYDEIGRLMESPLSYQFPLWHVTCFAGQDDGPGPASYLLFRVSHVVSDGQGLARALATLATDKSPSCPSKVHQAGRQFHRRPATMWPLCIVAYLMMFLVMIYNYINVLFHSRRSLRAPKHAVRHQVGFSSGVKVSEVKELRRISGTSFNDILVSCAASAIEGHLIECDKLHDRRTLFMIPTSLRADHDSTLSNQTSVFTLSVPIGVEPIARLAAVSRRMRRQKATFEPEIVYWMGKLFFRWPSLMVPGAFLTKYFNEVIVTNVPGPQSSALYLGDMPIVSMTPIVCLAHHNSIGIGILSLGDEVRFSVHMKLDELGDERAVYRRHSAQHIADLIAKSFEELRVQIRSGCLKTDSTNGKMTDAPEESVSKIVS